MVHGRPALPQGHGEVLTRPPLQSWEELAQRNRDRLSSADVLIGGEPLCELRPRARREALAAALEYSRVLGVDVDDGDNAENRLFALTGHQPDLIHPGVWVKHFLLDRMRFAHGAVAIDLVVDTDTYESVTLSAPCLVPDVRRCTASLSTAGPGATYGSAPVPDREAVEEFCRQGDSMTGTLPAPAIARHFSAFCDALRSAREDSDSLADLITIARRRFEAAAGTRYLELPVSRLAATPAFRRFAAAILLDARRFAVAHNQELAAYRALTNARSKAQPFPDLAVAENRIETPFWIMWEGRREPVYVAEEHADKVTLYVGDVPVGDVPNDASGAGEVLASLPTLTPRALTLTMFARLALGDIFIHGVGGGRYDSVTDNVIEAYFGIEPPPFVVASMTMYLPLGGHVVSDEEIAEARKRLHRLEHNPDDLLGEADFDSSEERQRAHALAAKKKDLVSKISQPGADKKRMGAQIREVNNELAGVLEPLAAELRSELASLEGQQASAEILTDRDYPFCFWSPLEVQDKAY